MTSERARARSARTEGCARWWRCAQFLLACFLMACGPMTDPMTSDAGALEMGDAGALELADAGVTLDAQDRDVRCVPRCRERACGDDGCGGSCGTCGGDTTCSPDGARCDCGDAAVTYAVSVSDVDWERTGAVVVTARQRFHREAAPTERQIVLDGRAPHAELTFEGACEPELEVSWVYVARERDALGRALVCEGDTVELHGETELTIPPGTGGACRFR
ncbi:MAG: hypothetical protein AB7S26_13210 [Sandaracinaceae bacterium]